LIREELADQVSKAMEELSGLDHQMGFRTAKGGNLKPIQARDEWPIEALYTSGLNCLTTAK